MVCREHISLATHLQKFFPETRFHTVLSKIKIPMSDYDLCVLNNIIPIRHFIITLKDEGVEPYLRIINIYYVYSDKDKDITKLSATCWQHSSEPSIFHIKKENELEKLIHKKTNLIHKKTNLIFEKIKDFYIPNSIKFITELNKNALGEGFESPTLHS